MPTTIQEIYTQVIRVPPAERLRLACWFSIIWYSMMLVLVTEQDQLDWVAFSLQYTATDYLESENLAEWFLIQAM